jgi:hypothetical protein
MTYRKPRNRNRRGAVAVLACLLMVVLLGMVAFAVDKGYFANTRTELQRSADSAALAGCWQLVNKGTPVPSIDLTDGIAAAPAVAAQYAQLNTVCNSAPSLANRDVVVGYIADPTQKGVTIGPASGNNYNAVQVTVRRTTDENGQAPSFFGRIFGVQGVDVSATATAALINNFAGFQTPTSGGMNGNAQILPFTLDKQTWIASSGGSLNLFPQGTGSPGNRGTANIGASNNSTATLCRQIVSGISPEDLAHYPNGLALDENGHLYLNANPGISAGCKDALASIIGQTRVVPIFDSVVGNGNNANYEIVGWVGVKILGVNLTGSMKNKYLMVQPTNCYLSGGIPATSSSGVQSSYGVYSPVWLVQ